MISQEPSATSPSLTEPDADPRHGSAAVLLGYLELLKLRISAMVLLTTLTGYLAAVPGAVELEPLLLTLLGTALAAAGANALNQFLERHVDAGMERTRRRPLPNGVLSPTEVLLTGTGMALAGSLLLYLTINPLTALLAAFTVVTYALLYTPLKRKTPFCTLIGAVPGALPVVMGVTAACGEWNLLALSLFLTLLFWQLPHFYAIAWIHREDYRRVGLPMLPVIDGTGRRTAFESVTCVLLTLAASLGPWIEGRSGTFYLVITLLLGLFYTVPVLLFARQRSLPTARLVFRASIIYLPLWLLALVFV